MVGLAAYSLVQPGYALVAAYWLVLLAGTKFRARSATDSLAGLIDAQIVTELVLYGLVGIIATGTVVSCGLSRTSMRRSDWILLAYISLALMSIMWSPDPQITAVRSIQLAVIFLLSFASIRVLGPARLLAWLTSSITGYILICALAAVVVPQASGTSVDYQGVSRFSWFSVHPVTAGAYAALASTLVLARGLFGTVEEGRNRSFLRTAIYLLPLVAVLLATRSRGAAAAWGVATLGLALRRFVRPWIFHCSLPWLWSWDSHWSTRALRFVSCSARGLTAAIQPWRSYTVGRVRTNSRVSATAPSSGKASSV